MDVISVDSGQELGILAEWLEMADWGDCGLATGLNYAEWSSLPLIRLCSISKKRLTAELTLPGGPSTESFADA